MTGEVSFLNMYMSPTELESTAPVQTEEVYMSPTELGSTAPVQTEEVTETAPKRETIRT